MQVTELAVYDFDKTVFSPDASFLFWLWLHRNCWQVWIDSCLLPIDIIRLGLRALSLADFKARRFRFIQWLSREDGQALIERFWQENAAHFHPWAKERIAQDKQDGLMVICISASTELLLAPAAQELGFDLLIGTRLLEQNGKIYPKLLGPNCKGYEKVHRLNTYFHGIKKRYHIRRFYSDSLHDKPLYDLSDEKFVIYKGQLSSGMPTRY